MRRIALLFTLMLSTLLLAGCWPAAPPPSTEGSSAPGAVATMTPRPASAGSSAEKASAPPKPTAKPAEAAKPVAAPTASTRPPAVASPEPPPAAARPPAVVATAVAGLPAVDASPSVSAESRGAAPADTLGVAASAGSVAAANASDTEATALCGPGAILSTRAGQMAGRPATVAIARVDASYQENVRGQPTFLNDAPYPNHVFTAVIWGDERQQFEPPPEAWQGKALCVTGPVELFQQRPQIVVASPSQLRAAR